MLDVRKISKMLGGLALLKYFPSDPEARGELAVMVCEMMTSEEQVDWLVRRMRTLYNEWPGPKEMRAVVCSKFKPADGIDCYSEVYMDGIPSERENLPALEAPRDPRSRELPPGEAGDLIRELAGRKRL